MLTLFTEKVGTVTKYTYLFIFYYLFGVMKPAEKFLSKAAILASWKTLTRINFNKEK
jgi:hypothetical protein